MAVSAALVSSRSVPTHPDVSPETPWIADPVTRAAVVAFIRDRSDRWALQGAKAKTDLAERLCRVRAAVLDDLARCFEGV